MPRHLSSITAPSKLEQQTAADWLRELLRENLVGACVQIDGQHLHVDLKRIRESLLDEHGTVDEKLADKTFRGRLDGRCVNCGGLLSLRPDCYPGRPHTPVREPDEIIARWGRE